MSLPHQPSFESPAPRTRAALFLAAVLLAFAGTFAHAADIAPDGVRLARFLDHSGVEHRWPAGVHIAWETGVPDGKPESGTGKHTHCSAFVAAEAKQLGIYILRPPEHGQILLANAQYEWLESEGRATFDSTPSTTVATSLIRTGAPFRYAMMIPSYCFPACS